VSIPKTCAVIGGGPAGLMAAETLAIAGCAVTVYDQMPSFGRKFLMAGIGGLNLTHSEDIDVFQNRYRGTPSLRPMIEAFGPGELRAWCEALEQETFIGSSGRIFPTAFKASPLLRAWLRRLEEQGVTFRSRHRWLGWRGDALVFDSPEGQSETQPDATLLALGGASWPRLGSDGAWAKILEASAIKTAPFKPSNCGFVTGWQTYVGSRFAGSPLKASTFSFGGVMIRSEAVVTTNGIEGSAIYALSPLLRDCIEATGSAVLHVDFKPDLPDSDLTKKLSRPRRGDSLSNRLRKTGLSAVAIAILREGVRPLPEDAKALAAAIKSTPITLNGISGLERAISSSGGVDAAALDERLMLNGKPGVFVAGEMLNWEAPTGGYLLQGCFASGRWAANGMLGWLGSSKP